VRRLKPWLILLVVVAAFTVRALSTGPVLTFVVAGVAIISLSALLGRATEELSHRIGSVLGSLLNATFGNAAEVILGLVALRRGLLAADGQSHWMEGVPLMAVYVILGLAFYHMPAPVAQ
jgi:Ca2+:H+ antiporter